MSKCKGDSPKKITIDDVEYVRASDVDNHKPAVNTYGLNYCIIRGDRSGVFAGYLDLDMYDDSRSVFILESRRIWYWSGAASISQLAVDGTSDPDNCKFPPAVAEQFVLDAIEIIPCTEKARESIQGVKEWRE